jgi:hypothetical protein
MIGAGPGIDRRSLLGASAAASLALLAPVGATGATARSGSRGFDFLIGRWRVKHRKLRMRLADSSDWSEFSGKLEVRPILSGLGNVDDNVVDDPHWPYRASSLRVFDAKDGLWSVYWIDARAEGIDKPVVGAFEGRTGRFYNDDEWDGRPVRVRFTYENLGPVRARWAQAFSPDSGRSWETNWIMEFSRMGQN